METAQRRVAITKLSRIPGYADGGEVSPWSLKGIANTVKGALQKTPEQIKRDAEMAEYRKNAEAERAAAKAPTATATPHAISTYAGNTVLDKRMAEAERKAGGGAIRGKGTGTSDEIPIMASNGEFVIRAAAVKEIGLPALRAINALGGALPKSPNRKDNKYAEGDIVKDRDALVAQIPTGSTGAGPTPAANQPTPGDGQMSYGDQMRNLGGALAAAPLAALKTVVSAPGYGLSSPSVPQPTPAPAVSQNYPEESQRAPAVNAPAPTAAPTSAPAGAIPLGGGISKIEQPGKSPLFTNLAADDPSNVALMNRKPMTAQDQGAMDGIQARQDANDQGMRNKMQYDAEVAQAQAFNAGQKQFHMEQAALKGNKGAQAILAGNLQADTTRRGQDITAKGQDIQAGALRASQKLAQDQFGLSKAKDGRESAASAMDQKSRQQLMDAQQEFLNAKTPDEQKAAERKLTTLGVKQTNDKGQVISLPDTLGDQGQVVRGGQAVLMPDGRIVRPEQSGQAALPPGMVKQIGTTNGKPVYLDKNGKQVIAKG